MLDHDLAQAALTRRRFIPLGLLGLALCAGCDAELDHKRRADSGDPDAGQTNNTTQNNQNNADDMGLPPRCEPTPQAPPPTDLMAYSRQLRRASLLLLGATPAPEDYEEIMAADSQAKADAILSQKIDAWMQRADFYRRLVDFGHNWITVGRYTTGAGGEAYWGHMSGSLRPCPADSPHAGALYLQPEGGYKSGDKPGSKDDPRGVCYDSAPDGSGQPYDVTPTDVEPWWAPGTTVKVIGRAGTGVRKHPAKDGNGDYVCGRFGGIYFTPTLADDARELGDPLCSCGPNLIYCQTYSGFGGNNALDLNNPRRHASEEPARFFAHLVWHDRPLHHLVTANYSVGTNALRHMYVRWARQNPENIGLDDLTWWKNDTPALADPEHDAKDPLAWREFVVESLNPHLRSGSTEPSGDLSRTATWDPANPQDGLATAGVLTMMGSMSSFPRERVRAARFIEIFGCRDFNPPPAEAHFAPYDRDPATTGTCQHCHQLMDPVSIAFKRWDFEGDYIWQLPVLGGIHTAQIKPDTKKTASPFRRWYDAWAPDTVLTPFSQEELDQEPHRLLMDTIPSQTPIFGVKNDGTAGPLGFGKILVKSGEFDRCAVRQLHRFAVGRDIDPAKEQGYLQALVDEFVAQDRQAKPLIKKLMLSHTFKRGL